MSVRQDRPGVDRPVRVALVEDDRRYRASLETLFGHAQGFELTAGFGSGEAILAEIEAPGRAGADPWDLVLMDLVLPGLDGVATIERLKRAVPGVAVVAITVLEDADTVLRAICAGADGYLAKRAPVAELLSELRAIVAGGAPLSAGVARTVLNLLRRPAGPVTVRGPGTAKLFKLTERERSVLRLLVQGLSYRRVADELGISIDTVRSHVRRVYGKLQVHSVAQAVGRAIREGLV